MIPGAVIHTAAGASSSVAGATFSTLAAVLALALLAPLLVSLRPSLRIPLAVAELLLGILFGPSGLGLIHPDAPVTILSELGLATLLFLAGLEIDLATLRGGLLRLLSGYGVSVTVAVALAFAVSTVESISSPLLVGFALASSTVGVIVPVLRDAQMNQTKFGQRVLASASLGEFAAILLISLFFSQHASSTGSQLFLLGLFALVVLIAAVALSGLAQSAAVSRTLQRLERTTAQLGVRAAVALVAGFAALATALGLETILAVFVAGVILRWVDEHERLVHADFRLKMEGIGYGFLVPVFFVTSGLQLNFRSLLDQPGHLALVGLFLGGLLLARGLPALLQPQRLENRQVGAMALLQAVSLPVVVIAANLGHQLHILDDGTGAALVVAGVLSVSLFPSLALLLLERETRPSAPAARRRTDPAPPPGAADP